MASIVQVDKKFNISLKKVKDALKIMPNDTFSIERHNAHIITLKKIEGNDPFIDAIKNPAHIHHKKPINLDRLEDDQWST